jgi:hypothetical protein
MLSDRREQEDCGSNVLLDADLHHSIMVIEMAVGWGRLGVEEVNGTRFSAVERWTRLVPPQRRLDESRIRWWEDDGDELQ